MSARERAARVPALLAAALLAPLFTALPVAAEPTGPAAEEPPTPAQVLAEALAASPVHVDPAFATAFPEARQEGVAETIAQGGLENLYVVAVPIVAGDAWDGDASALIAAVHDRMGGGEAHFLVHDGRRLTGEDFGPAAGSMGPSPAFHGSLTASYRTMGQQEAAMADEVDIAVETALSDDPEAVYEAAIAAYEEERGDTYGSFPPRGWMSWAAGVGAAAAAVLLGAGLYRIASRSRRSPVGLAQHAAFDNADRARLESLHARGERDLVELGERLSSASDVAGRHLARALDARDAAARVHDRMAAEGPNLADAVGVLVLLDLAEDALAGRRTPRRPCYANPLHGTDTRQVQWREFGGERSIRVPLCRECAAAVRKRVRPTVLPDEHDGRGVPYYEVPARESVWAATGYGTLADDLVQRIQRGDHRRASDTR
ncbi:hypothetical protein [Nocardiopsis sp. LOL_012]|uniref:hypothetical protein n=1 Tax=Nocardiopsis sp. LOL_012 TaxID=3345409 RepID=UPI003A87FCF4